MDIFLIIHHHGKRRQAFHSFLKKFLAERVLSIVRDRNYILLVTLTASRTDIHFISITVLMAVYLQ